ncbi:MAG: hypothetical protein ACLQAT_26205 [Candidatus Binataceae bacterium]
MKCLTKFALVVLTSVVLSLAAVLLGFATIAGAQSSVGPPMVQQAQPEFDLSRPASQPGDGSLAPQHTNSNALTIGPQPAGVSARPGAEEVPDASGYTPFESNDALNRDFIENNDRARAELGMTIVYGKRVYDQRVSTYCSGFSASQRAPESFGPMRVPVHGLEVVSVKPGSPAAVAGLRGRVVSSEAPENRLVSWLSPDRSVGTGDFIVAVDGWPASSPEDLSRVLRNTPAGGSILLTVVHEGRDDEEPVESLVVVPVE